MQEFANMATTDFLK